MALCYVRTRIANRRRAAADRPTALCVAITCWLAIVCAAGQRRGLRGANVHFELGPAQLAGASPAGPGGSRSNRSRTTLRAADIVNADAAVRRRCAVARGAWCGLYLRQVAVPTRPVPRGAKDCPNACSGWGNCNHDTGMCECPAGRGGPDCGEVVKRPCADGHRGFRDANRTHPLSSLGPDNLDKDVTQRGWTASRCFGYCQDDIAACFCGYNSRFRHIPAPPGSPPWTPPVQHGRPLADGCQSRTNAAGLATFNPGSPFVYEQIYGPEGWCNKQDSATQCGCLMEMAPPCDGSVPMETTCANQCSGHGDCHFGYCRCHPQWYGADCSRKRAHSGDMEPGMHESARPWLRRVVQIPPAALPVPALPTRPRPLIYVYDVPPEFTSRMLQYRVLGDTCLWRRWFEGNVSAVSGYTYGVETLMHELMLQSVHRTFDPEEADFFYVPMYITCYFWPIMGWADFPWYDAPIGPRPMHGANLITKLLAWLKQLPWWGRRSGRDHIWLMPHDEGACWMPKEAYDNSIVLTHWGRLDPNHWSNTAYFLDNYTESLDPLQWNAWPGVDFHTRIDGHPCYDPRKDLVIPAFKGPSHYASSPLLGAAPMERDILLFFRGDIGAHRDPNYSRGIRQRLFNLSVQHDWWRQHRIVIAAGGMVPGEYSQQLARSKFCLVAPGDGWSPRAEDAILHGCIPLVVMDEVHAVFESVLDWDAFSIRIRESALEAVPQVLAAVTPERLAHMQRHLANVWHRFAYTSGPLLRGQVEDALVGNNRNRETEPELPPDYPYPRTTSFAHSDDAFQTIVQWLYHRIAETR